MNILQAAELLTSVFAHNLNCMEKERTHNDFIVPMFLGDPGVGKTAIPQMVAKEVGVPYFETIVAQYDAGEMAGLPFIGDKEIKIVEENDGHHTERFEKHTRMVRLRPDYAPDIHDPEQRIGIWNLDELPQAFLANQNICSQIVNAWKIGKHEISRGITMCATGNKPENKAGTTTMPMHLRDRLMFISVDVDSDIWLKYAATVGVDGRIRAFIRNNPGSLHEFKVGANAFPTPRSWDKCSSVLAMDLPGSIRTEALSGNIGEGMATTFETWIRVEDKMPKLEDIIANPLTAPVFGNSQANIAYLLLAALSDATTPKNVEAILQYIDRMPNKEFAAVYAADAFNRDKSLLDTKVVTKWKMTTGAKLAL
jgi:hypothetical protein